MLAHLLITTFAVAEPPSETSDLVARLRLRYPAFTNVADATIEYWLTDAARIVTPSWFSEDIEPATLALAAHNMSINGVPGISQAAAISLPAGVTRFRSASMDVGISESAANRSVNGGYGSTRYGQEFEPMLRRNRGGLRIVGCVTPVHCW